MTDEEINLLPTGHDLDVLVSAVFGLAQHPYSSDIAAAWKLIASLERQGLRLMLDRRGSQGGVLVSKWHAAFSDDATTDYFTADAITAPHAICRAALKAAVACNRAIPKLA